jgi:hypothetical protein
MSRRCARPELQAQILEAARARRALDLELSLHAAGCRACRTAAERLRRMVAVWAADRADDGKCAAAAERFVARLDRSSQSSRRHPTFFVAVGAAATAALLLTLRGSDFGRRSSRTVGEQRPPNPASAAPDTALLRTIVATAAPAGAAQVAVLAGVRGHVQGPRGVVALADGARVELHQGESAKVMLADGSTSDLRGPCLVEFWSSTTEVGGWKVSYLPVASELNSIPAAAETPAPRKRRCDGQDVHCRASAAAAIADPRLDRAWARAAEALRREDFAAADQAFGDLERGGDGPTRDAARLARAQLWIAHGRGAAARAVLEDLSTTGATPLVRQRAAECLGRANH